LMMEPDCGYEQPRGGHGNEKGGEV